MNGVAIIPARGGSKRIPDKNIKSFCGLPIIAYSIKIAQESGLFQRVIVSTDSEKIARIAKRYGAEVPFLRPLEIADDFSTSDDALVHALKFLDTKKQLPKLCCCIYATAPFLQVQYLKKGLDLIRKNKESASFSVARAPFPLYRALRLSSRNQVSLFWPKYERSRSQDIEDAFYDAGQFYWVHTKSFLRNKTTFPSASYPVIIPRYLVHDLDIPADWKSAEIIYKILYSK